MRSGNTSQSAFSRLTNSGFLLIDKPEGPTSHDVVDALRGVLGVRRIGHSGTLDPFASGLLILGIGKATRLLEYLGKEDKTYQFELALGSTSDTYDRTGKIQPYKDSFTPDRLDTNIIRDVLKEYLGEQMQTPPPFSAIKYKGKKLYEYARKGETIEIKPRSILIHSLSLLSCQYPRVSLEARVSKGTYIRSLGHEIGKRLGTGAYVNTLRRTAIGLCHVGSAFLLEKEIISGSNISERIVTIKDMFPQWFRVILGEESLERIKNGSFIALKEKVSGLGKEEMVLIMDQSGSERCVAKLTRAGAEWKVSPGKYLGP